MDEEVSPDNEEAYFRRNKCFKLEVILSLTAEQVQMLVMADKEIRNHVNLHQVIYLFENLSSVHSSSDYIQNKVNIARDMFNVENLTMLLQIAADIIHLPDIDKQIEHKHALLVKETQELANILYAKISLAVQDYIHQQYSIREEIHVV